MTHRNRDILVLPGLVAVRRRPTLYIGEPDAQQTLHERLIETVVAGVMALQPSVVRLIVWTGGATSIAYDGTPLPIRTEKRSASEVEQPELYRLFLDLVAPSDVLSTAATAANALSERLVVSTVHAAARFRMELSRGGIVSLLRVAAADELLGSSWLTLLPDADLLPLDLDLSAARRIAARVTARTSVSIEVIDRPTEAPDW